VRQIFNCPCNKISYRIEIVDPGLEVSIFITPWTQATASNFLVHFQGQSIVSNTRSDIFNFFESSWPVLGFLESRLYPSIPSVSLLSTTRVLDTPNHMFTFWFVNKNKWLWGNRVHCFFFHPRLNVILWQLNWNMLLVFVMLYRCTLFAPSCMCW